VRVAVAAPQVPFTHGGAEVHAEGLRDALRDAGHQVDERLIEAGDFTEEGGHRAMTELLARCPGLDAVFAGSDVMAAGARQVLREKGRRIPDDVALVGYDDSAIARHMDPPLTSVRQPIEEMGRRMIDLLLEEIADRRPAVSRGLERRQVVLATELVTRTSS
jgi:DNA-binding LacI/PurR family transcriptional regulator